MEPVGNVGPKRADWRWTGGGRGLAVYWSDGLSPVSFDFTFWPADEMFVRGRPCSSICMFLRWPSLRLADWRVSEINNGQLTIGQGCHVESSLLKRVVFWWELAKLVAWCNCLLAAADYWLAFVPIELFRLATARAENGPDLQAVAAAAVPGW